MQTLKLAIHDTQHLGERIKLPFGLDRHIRLNTQDVVVLAGAPGAGKSTFAVNLVANMRVPMLYLAQDSPNSVMARIIGLTIGEDTGTVLTKLQSEDGREALSEEFGSKLPGFVFHRGQVTVAQIEKMCRALREWMGTHPPVVVVDNLIDLVTEGTNSAESGFYANNLQLLKDMAQRLNVAVIILHHTTRGGAVEHGRGRKPLRLTDLLYAGEREARHVWGIYNNGEDTLTLQVLKQTDGKADPEGDFGIDLRWYPERAKIERKLT